MIGLIIWNIVVSFVSLCFLAKYYHLNKLGAIFLRDNEKEVLKQSIEEHIRLLTVAIPKEIDGNKRKKYILTRSTMLNIQEKLEEKL